MMQRSGPTPTSCSAVTPRRMYAFSVTFEAWTRDRLQELKDDNDHISDTIRGLEEKRASNNARIAELQRARDLYREFSSGDAQPMPRDVPSTNEVEQEGFLSPTDELTQVLLKSSIADGAELILRQVGGTARTLDIARVLVDAGKIKSKYAPNQVFASLLRHPERFEKAGAGRWRLPPSSLSTTDSQQQVTE